MARFDPNYNSTALWNALETGNYQRLDIALRDLLAQLPGDEELLHIMGRLAERLARPQLATAYLQKAGQQPTLAGSIEPSSEDRFLLITEWGFGFWADVTHVLGSLLLAEMTSRRPLVFWSDNSLFSPGGENAWNRYFQPVSSAALADLSSPSHSYFPPPWSRERLQDSDLSAVRTERHQSTFGLGLLPRDENVVVSDTFVSVTDLIGFIEPDDPRYGLDVVNVQRSLVAKYLRLAPHLQHRVDTFWDKVMSGRRWLAVHYRDGDKGKEVLDLPDLNAQYPAEIDAILQSDPDLFVFVMTDSGPFLKQMLERYPNRSIAAAAIRSWSDQGVHLAGHDPVKIAEEVILDTYIAARCDRFLGNGLSNVSLAVGFLKDWADDSYRLLGKSWRDKRYLFG